VEKANDFFFFFALLWSLDLKALFTMKMVINMEVKLEIKTKEQTILSTIIRKKQKNKNIP
jgi:hypothetical protein